MGLGLVRSEVEIGCRRGIELDMTKKNVWRERHRTSHSERTVAADSPLLSGRDVEMEQSGCLTVRLLRLAEIQDIFNCSSRAVRRWAERGYLRPIRVDRVLYFRQDDIDSLTRGPLRSRARGNGPQNASTTDQPKGLSKG